MITIDHEKGFMTIDRPMHAPKKLWKTIVVGGED